MKRTNSEIVKSYYNAKIGMGEAVLEHHDDYAKALQDLDYKMAIAKTDEARWALNKVKIGLKTYVNYNL